MKKQLAVLAAGILAVGVSVGCGNPSESGGVSIDPTKTLINIAVYSGGFGSEWLDRVLEKYNATQDEYQFFINNREKFSLETITAQAMSNNLQSDIYFSDGAELARLIRGGYLEDLSDIYETSAPGESEPIRNKMKSLDSFSNIAVYEGKYYALPFTQGIGGIVYDHDLFEEKNLLLKDASTENGYSTGVDGIEGTYDDGLPATMEELVALMDKIVSASMKSVIFPSASDYASGLIWPVAEAVWAQYDGLENYSLSFTYDGTYTSPSTGKETEITLNDGWKSYAEGLQEGRIKAVEFVHDVLLNDDYRSDVDAINHTQAQDKFIYSHNSGQTRIAMIVEGCWWEFEAKAAFETDAGRTHNDAYAYGNRDMRFLPLPSYPESKLKGKAVFATNNDGSVIVKKQSDGEKLEAIKDFLRYFCSDEVLSTFTSVTNAVLPYEYTLSESQYEGLTKFGKNLWAILSAENTVIVRPYLEGYREEINYLGAEVADRWAVNKQKYASQNFENVYAQLVSGVENLDAASYAELIRKSYDETSWLALLAANGK